MAQKKFSELSEEERQQHFIRKADIVDCTIKAVRYMTEKEADEMGWGGKSVVLVLDNGTEVVVSGDDEGNHAGALFICKKNGDQETLPVF